MIPLTKPSINKNEIQYFKKILNSKILTDGYFQKKAESLIKKQIKSNFVAITHSCTAALEISSILINLKHKDEVIMPSYGFVSLANAIALRGARPIFADIDPKTLNISLNEIKKRSNSKTKAIYLIHYAGNSCEIEKIQKFAKSKKIYLIEDAAHSYLGKFNNKFLGTIGDIGVFSFHETKNIVGGQAGCISINNKSLIKRANYILDKGTNRREFIKNFRKKIITPNNKKFYSWVDLGSEYRAPELSCALLYSQLIKADKIQKKRLILWRKFNKLLSSLNSDKFYIIKNIKKSKSTFHLLAIVFKNKYLSSKFIEYLQKRNIAATFHYVPLHKSKMGKKFCKYKLPITENIFNKIVRIPFFSDMNLSEFNKISKTIKKFFYEKK